jgi:thiol:disulfide interchange protein DsbD
MALTFTINSFTCTGPFLGPLLSSVKELKLSSSEVAVSALVYSSAFAAPFFVLALFPRLLKSLPKSGGWLNATKVVMGFIEIGLALKFLAITDSGFFPGNPRFFNYDTVLCTWMALSVACGLYLLGFYRLPHDTPLNNVGVPRLLLATFFLGLSVYMAPLLWRKPPQGAVGDFLNAWLPQDSAPTPSETASASNGATKSAAELSWTRDYEKAWEQARQEHKLLLVDFTGVNCQNCRYNEKNVFPRAEVAAEFARFVRLQLYTDQIPDRTLTADQSYQKAQEHQKWQQETFQDVSLPLYAVLDPSTADKPFTSDGRMAGTIKGRASGTIDDVGGFVTMLKRAQGK